MARRAVIPRRAAGTIRLFRAGAIVFVVLVGTALATYWVSGSRSSDDADITPHATVVEFLDTALVRHDPEGACEFLTPRQRSRVGASQGCDLVFGRLPRRRSLAGVRVSDGTERLTVTGLDAPLTLRLVPLATSARPKAVAPASGWRIASGAEALPVAAR